MDQRYQSPADHRAVLNRSNGGSGEISLVVARVQIVLTEIRSLTAVDRPATRRLPATPRKVARASRLIESHS